jgi:hypothetical protein
MLYTWFEAELPLLEMLQLMGIRPRMSNAKGSML